MNSIVIFGGAGFVGKNLIRQLALNGYKIIVPYQRPTNEAKLRLLGNFGQIIPFYFDSLKDERISNILKSTNVCINLKTNWESRRTSFKQSILKFNADLLDLIKLHKSIKQFIFFSGLGVDNDSKSMRSLAIYETEKLILSSFSNSIIIRPGIIIGKDDNFLSRLMPIFKISKFIPIFGSGRSKIQPIYIEDISKTIEKIILNKIEGNHRFELVGPNIIDYKELYSLISKVIDKNKIFIQIPMSVAKILVSILEKTPFSPLNLEQLRLFEKDNIAKNTENGLHFFSIVPKDTIEIIKKIAKN